MKRGQYKQAFTVVELMIVVVVIGILASITVVAYRGAQGEARDTERRVDIADIREALELYYLDNNTYPTSTGSTKINPSWVTSSDASWANLASQLVPKYLPSLPVDPEGGTTTNPAISSGFNYDYIRLTNSWCATSSSKPGYLLAYRLESSPQERKIDGDCPVGSTQPTDYPSSEYIRGD
ncbi:MAG: type II secretion system protein GspG [Patescibacteria group bacterium]